MANRDLNFTPEVNNVVADKTTGFDLAAGAAQIGATIADQSAQSKLLANTAKAHVAFKGLDAQFRTKFADDPTSPEGLKWLQEQRATVADDLGQNIPLLYGRQWQNKTIELGTQSDVSNEIWAVQQQHTNTINNFNGSMMTYLDSANKDGQAFGVSGGGDLSGAMNYLSSRAQLEQAGAGILGDAKTQTMLKTYNRDYVKSFISGVAEKNPQTAAELINSPEINQHFTTEEKGMFINQIERVKKQQELQKSLSVTANNSQLVDIVNDSNSSSLEKVNTIQTLRMQGSITSTAASNALAVVHSKEAIDTVTDTPVMSEIINQVYDLNANSASNAGDYLRGVKNIQEKILEKQASGELTAQDAGKLNRQLTTLTNKRTSEATQQVGNEFYDANQKFNSLPPEYRGQATRQLFDMSDGKSYTKQQYAEQANGIIDGINQKRRAHALKVASNSAMNDEHLLKSLKLTSADVAETARVHHITEAEVLRQVRLHVANKAGRASEVSRIAPDEVASTPSAPVVLTPMDGNGADTESTGGDLNE